MTPLDLAMRLLKDDELPNFCQSCEGAGCKGCDNTGLDVSERFHQEHEPMSVDDMESYYDESHLGHIGRFEANPVEIFQDIIEDTPEGRRKQTNIMGATYRGEPTFNMMPLAGAGRPMVNPHAEIFRRGEPMDLAMQLLKSPLDLLSAHELFELSAIGTDDPELVEMHLGEHRTLTPEEAEDISWRAVDAQIAEGDASHPEGMSHEENVKQFRGRGGRPVNWGFNVGTRFGSGDEEGEMHWEKSPPTIGPPLEGEAVFIPPGPNSPEIIANQPWPMRFTTENKSEPMDIAFQMLKAPYLPESFTPTQDEFQMPNQPDWAQGAQGVFGHPEMPQVQYPMSISYTGKNPYVAVKDPANGEIIAYSMFRYEPHPYDEEEPGYFVSDDTWVHEDHRRKNLGPSMYNFFEHQLRPHGLELRTSEHLTDEGERMWLREQGEAESHRTPWISTV